MTVLLVCVYAEELPAFCTQSQRLWVLNALIPKSDACSCFSLKLYLEDFGVSKMADASPRTDTSTDADTEDKRVIFIMPYEICFPFFRSFIFFYILFS